MDDELSGKLEFPTDPQTMQEMTPDSRYDPLVMLLEIEVAVQAGELNSIEEYFEMSNKQSEKTETTPAAPATPELLALNTPMPGALGFIYIDTNAHAHFKDEAARLKRRIVNALYWIAQYTGDFGVLPSMEDVFEKAQMIAVAPDAHLYVRDNNYDSHQFHEQETRQAVSGSQMFRIEQNSKTVLQLAPVIKMLATLGYDADHLTREDLYTEVNEQQRQRNQARNAQEDNAKLAQKQRMQAASKQVDLGL